MDSGHLLQSLLKQGHSKLDHMTFEDLKDLSLLPCSSSCFRFCLNNEEECKADIQQEAVSVPITGGAQGQARWSPGQPDLVGDNQPTAGVRG